MTTSTIFRFTTYAAAKHFISGAVYPLSIVLGDDQKFWVVTCRDYSRLLAAGYEAAE